MDTFFVTLKGDVMAKRFTDTGKWRNEWFRTLPIKAKLVWTYLCDECDFSGVWKADWGLASFQLDFKITPEDLSNWFAEKIHFIGVDRLLIIQFFEFQYGDSKDSWSAKIKATSRLEGLGFIISDNKVKLNHSDPTVTHSGTTVLSVGVGKGIGKGIKGGLGEKDELLLEEIYSLYPRKKGKSAGLKKLKTLIKTPEDADQIKAAIGRFSRVMEAEKRPADKIPYFSTFINEQLNDYLSDEALSDKDFSQNTDASVDIDQILAKRSV